MDLTWFEKIIFKYKFEFDKKRGGKQGASPFWKDYLNALKLAFKSEFVLASSSIVYAWIIEPSVVLKV